MSIIASYVAHRRAIVVENPLNALVRSVVVRMLDRIPRQDTKVSYQYEMHIYHFLVENEIVYGCVSNVQYEAHQVYGFLVEVKALFKAQFLNSADGNRSFTAITATNCRAFGATLAVTAACMTSNPRGYEKVERVKEQLHATTKVMLDNIDSVLERRELIESLCDRTDSLRAEAHVFHAGSRSLKQKLLKHNIILVCATVVGVAIIGCVVSFIFYRLSQRGEAKH